MKGGFCGKRSFERGTREKSNNGIVAAYNSLGCTYAAFNRSDEALAALLKGYRACKKTTKLSLRIDILSRLSSRYADIVSGLPSKDPIE